jgi:hypothetical protein
LAAGGQWYVAGVLANHRATTKRSEFPYGQAKDGPNAIDKSSPCRSDWEQASLERAPEKKREPLSRTCSRRSCPSSRWAQPPREAMAALTDQIVAKTLSYVGANHRTST